MKISIDSTALTREREFALQLPKRIRAKAWTRIRIVSFEAERDVKLQMPVDTRRARASWGHSSAPAAVDESIWEEDSDALAITQGSRVEYIEYLNEGSSKQAPAGFIDAIELKAVTKLADALGVDLEDLFT